MNELEELARAAMHRHAPEAPTVEGLLDRVARRERVARRHRQQWSAAAAVVAVGAIVGTGALLHGSPSRTSPGVGTSPTPAPIVVPSGPAPFSAEMPASGPVPSSAPTTPVTSPTVAALRPDQDATVCGTWSQETGPFAQAIAPTYGALEQCFPYVTTTGVDWIVTTDGRASGPGWVGIDVCASATADCADGRTDHTGDHWAWVQADRPGMVKLDGAVVPGQPLDVRVGGLIESFDVASRTFHAGQADTSTKRPVRPVAGVLEMTGGVVNAVDPVDGVVTFHSPDGTVSGVATKDGSFTVTLPPGLYTVTGTSPHYGDNTYLCGDTAVVVPTVGHVATVHVACQMR